MSILSWDDYEDDHPLKTAEDQSLALQAAENIKNLDLTAAHQELRETEVAISARANKVTQPQPTTELEVQAKDLAAQAKANIQDLMRYLDEGGRVQVDDKQLFNCNSDLNQLVPFKYNWAWSLYLTSTEHHWMPAEHSFFNDVNIYKTLPTSLKSIFQRLQRWGTIQQAAFNLKDLLNCYRLITNPECRQYILRQSFETSVATHVQKEMEDSFEIRKTLIDGYTLASHRHLDQEIYQTIMNLIWKHTSPVRDRESVTGTPETLTDFLIALIIQYLVVGNLLPTYHYLNVMEVARLNKMSSVSTTMTLLLRDVQTQNAFIQLFIQNALAENPQVDLVRIQQTVNKVVSDVFVQLQDLLSLLTVGENNYTAHSQIYLTTAKETLTAMGVGYTGKQPTPRVSDSLVDQWYRLLQGLKPKVDHEAGLSGSGGSLGW